MRTKIAGLVFVACMVLSMCGCAQNASAAPSAPEEITPTAETVDKYDRYELDSQESQFNLAIADNPIDEAYAKEINQAGTVDEMAQVETKYISLWQNELANTVARYRNALSEEDKMTFDEAQSSFDAYIQISFDFASEMLLENKYDIQTGTASRWLLYSERREAVRERTIYVKYLHYLLERAAGAESEFESLIFG